MKREKGGGKGNADDVTDVDLLFCVCEKRIDVDFHNNDMEHNTRYRVKYVQTRCFVPTQQQRPQSSVSFCLSCVFSSSGFLGDGDVVTQAIHDAQLLLRSHNTGGRERDRDRERERDGSRKMVSSCPNYAVHTHTLKRSVCPEPPSGVHLVTST